MRHTLVLVSLLAISCSKKEKEQPAAAEKPSEPGSVNAGSAEVVPPAPAPTPAPPPPTPVKMTADELKPTCAKIFTAEIASKTFGATEVKQEGEEGKRLALCHMNKDGESVGSVTIACNPDLDASLIERERGAMTKAKDLPAPIGRGGYRLANSFIIIDDETPCRLMINMMQPPADDVLATALRDIVAAVNPGTLK